MGRRKTEVLAAIARLTDSGRLEQTSIETVIADGRRRPVAVFAISPESEPEASGSRNLPIGGNPGTDAPDAAVLPFPEPEPPPEIEPETEGPEYDDER